MNANTRHFSNCSNARRAARKALGQNANEGVDFQTYKTDRSHDPQSTLSTSWSWEPIAPPAAAAPVETSATPEPPAADAEPQDAVEVETDAATAPQKRPVAPGKRSARSTTAAKGEAPPAPESAPRHASRANSKQAQLIAMLQTPEGATVPEVVAKFDWQPHTVRSAISHALGKKLGLKIGSERVEGRGRVYRVLV